jgi:O-antigen biosynthesis protein
VDSNYLVEAMLCGTPAVNLIGTAMLPGPPAFDGASGVVEAEPAELATRLRELMQDSDIRARRLAQAAGHIEYYNVGGVDGQSSTRVAAEMVRLARAGPMPSRTSPQRLNQRLRDAGDVVVGQVRKQR